MYGWGQEGHNFPGITVGSDIRLQAPLRVSAESSQGLRWVCPPGNEDLPPTLAARPFLPPSHSINVKGVNDMTFFIHLQFFHLFLAGDFSNELNPLTSPILICFKGLWYFWSAFSEL